MENFIEYLETLKDLRHNCSIRFRDVQGMVSTIEGHIVKTEEVSGRHMIETDAGLLIGVDQIISVNGRPADNYC